MALTKTDETTVYAIALTASNSVSISNPIIDVADKYAGHFRVRLGRGTGSAFTTPPIVRIEGSAETGTPTANQWAVLAQFQMSVGASLGSQAVSGTEAAGQTVVSLAAGTNFAAGDYVFFHNTTIGNSEWARVIAVSGADITLEEGLVNAQTGATVRDQAEQYQAYLDLLGINKIRVVVDGNSSGQAVVCEVVAGFVSAL